MLSTTIARQMATNTTRRTRLDGDEIQSMPYAASSAANGSISSARRMAPGSLTRLAGIGAVISPASSNHAIGLRATTARAAPTATRPSVGSANTPAAPVSIPPPLITSNSGFQNER